MKSIFKNSIIIAALLFGAASVSHAQVKVGANPATIGTNSNLEVEAANGNKTIVDKATGQVTIQDGTQGAGKVLISDANGASSWQAGVPGVPNAEVMVSAKLTIAQSLPYYVLTKINFDAETFDKNNNFDLASDQLTAPSTGYYLVNVAISRSNAGVPNAFEPFIYVNNADSGEGALFTHYTEAVTTYIGSGMRLIRLNAGDVMEIRVRATVNNDGLNRAFLQIAKISN